MAAGDGVVDSVTMYGFDDDAVPAVEDDGESVALSAGALDSVVSVEWKIENSGLELPESPSTVPRESAQHGVAARGRALTDDEVPPVRDVRAHDADLRVRDQEVLRERGACTPHRRSAQSDAECTGGSAVWR